MFRSPLLRLFIGLVFGAVFMFFIQRLEGDRISDMLEYQLPSDNLLIERIMHDDNNLEPAEPINEGADHPQVETPETDPNEKVKICTNDERLQKLDSACPNSDTNIFNVKERWLALTNIFVDPIHKILACLPPKSGCTTWKNILANNSRDEPLPVNFNMMMLHYGDLPNYGIKLLSTYNRTMQTYMLNNYFKFLVARHPLERFRSAYIDKLQSGKDISMQRSIGGPILDKYRPFMDERQRKNGKGVTISEFTKYLKEEGLKNPHWNSIHLTCQPCHIKYDRIVKTETLDHDNVYIILNKLGPYSRGLGTKGNIVAGGHQDTSLTPLGRKLEIYNNASIADMEFFSDMYKEDFKYFGYSWKYHEIDGKYSVRSSCVDGGVTKPCC